MNRYMDLGFMVRIVQLGFIILMTRTSLLRFNFGLTRIIEMGFKICIARTIILGYTLFMANTLSDTGILV